MSPTYCVMQMAATNLKFACTYSWFLQRTALRFAGLVDKSKLKVKAIYYGFYLTKNPWEWVQVFSQNDADSYGFDFDTTAPRPHNLDNSIQITYNFKVNINNANIKYKLTLFVNDVTKDDRTYQLSLAEVSVVTYYKQSISFVFCRKEMKNTVNEMILKKKTMKTLSNLLDFFFQPMEIQRGFKVFLLMPKHDLKPFLKLQVIN